LEQCLQGIHNLLPDPFLNGETLREQANEARELGDANDPRASDVAHVGMPEKWQGVVFAERKERDRPLDHLVQSAIRLSPAFGREGRDQLGVAVIACRYVQEGADKAPWGVPRGRGVWIKPKRREDLGRVGLEHTAQNTGKTHKSAKGAAKSGAFEGDLDVVIEAWPTLPDGVRAHIVALVRDQMA
jgi:hypothetical protein